MGKACICGVNIGHHIIECVYVAGLCQPCTTNITHGEVTQMQGNNLRRLFLLSCVLGVVGLVIFYLATTSKDFNQPKKTFAELGGDFTLQSSEGPVSLYDFKGQVVVMYFGYLSCAEVCPNSLAVLTGAMMRLEKSHPNAIQGLFVTVDPTRDTPAELEEYTAYFHDDILGLTGTVEQVKSVSGQYGVFYDNNNLSDSFMEYSVSHASRFYILDKSSKLITAMSHTTTPNELAAQIRELL
ncbi:SCO family protein [Pseudoalteromonas aurantia]|uniref:SCO family protein n=2 Tax=Pseudoalteromonas aurantia TaxID=43654 RepID=A0A5S3VA21_9GAMM|nr:SCO family protein [Pseudoalteromonas aurantia]